jgi:uncharacterized membrane protein
MAINSNVVGFFADSSFIVFSEFKHVIILIDVLYKFEWLLLFFSKKNKVISISSC